MKKFLTAINLQSQALLLLVGVVLSATNINAQQYSGFSEELVSSLNTAAHIDYLSKEEKEAVLLINLMRHDGNAFWNNIAQPYIQTQEITISKYVRSLERDLKATRNLQPLAPSRMLFEAAKTHAVASGKEGAIGHKSSAGSFEKRLQPLSSDFNYIIENCDYGSSTALGILMNLMIDEGIPSVGHRKNILHLEINAIGLAIAPHKSYQYTCVQVFGMKR